MVTSATQVETFNECPRKWWLEAVRGLKRAKTQPNTFGTCMHGVCERYLRADDLGRDEKGQPVELFPQGWDVAIDKFTGEIEGKITLQEQATIRGLIQAAIEAGVLQRVPGRRVEEGFRVTVCQFLCPKCSGQVVVNGVKCDHCKGDGKGTHVQMQGFIDYLKPDGVEDHKSTKSMRYAKSPAALAKNPQMLIYAKVAIDKMRSLGIVPADPFNLRHNQYCKDPHDLRVKKTEVQVSIAEIEAHWGKVVETVGKMDYYRRTANRWSEIPDPPSLSVCSNYGGCHFMYICTGQESEEAYETRLARHVNNGYTLPTLLTVNGATAVMSEKGSDSMNAPGAPVDPFAAQLAQRRGAVPGATPGQVNPPMPAQMTQQAGQVAQTMQQPPVNLGYAAPAQQPFSAPPVQQYQPPAVQQPPAMQAAPQQFQQPASAPQPQQQEMYQGQYPVAPPPWSVQGCGACGGIGFNTAGDACRVCSHQSEQAGRPGSDAFDILPQGDGFAFWRNKTNLNIWGCSRMAAGHGGVTVTQQSGATPGALAQSAGNVPMGLQPPAPQGAPLGAAPSQPSPTTSQGDGEKEGDEGGKGGRGGRPAKGFTLIINGSVVRGAVARGDRTVHHLDQLLHSLGQEIAAARNVPSFYDLPVDQRRDMLAKAAPQIAEKITNGILIARGVGLSPSDMKSLTDALTPLAGLVIVAEATL